MFFNGKRASLNLSPVALDDRRNIGMFKRKKWRIADHVTFIRNAIGPSVPVRNALYCFVNFACHGAVYNTPRDTSLFALYESALLIVLTKQTGCILQNINYYSYLIDFIKKSCTHR